MATVGSVLSDANSEFTITQSFEEKGAKTSSDEAEKLSKKCEADVVVKTMENLCRFVNLSASSRVQLLPCLIDGSTETFWESGDEVFLSKNGHIFRNFKLKKIFFLG